MKVNATVLCCRYAVKVMWWCYEGKCDSIVLQVCCEGNVVVL